MGLLERVGTLIRANLNDLIDRAEDPEKLLKQLVLDMQNQLMQVKTQVAIAVADRHLLERKRKESETAEAGWLHKAEVALTKGRNDLARDAVDKALSCKQAAAGYAGQLVEQTSQAEQLKSALLKLERKLAETRAQCDLLSTQQRRARAVRRGAVTAMESAIEPSAMDRMRNKVVQEEALAAAHTELAALDSTTELQALEREERIEQVLTELRRKATSASREPE